MRALGIGLAAALIVAALSPQFAWAAAKDAKTSPISKELRAAGMAAAPGLVSAAGADCQIADARQVGSSVDPKTKVKSSLYELACTNNLGLLLVQAADAPPSVFTCLEAAEPRADGKPAGTQCILPGNAAPRDGLIPYVAKSGIPCTLAKTRAVGHSATLTVVEVTCQEANGGYIMQISSPPRLDKPITMNPCIGYTENGNIKCTLTERSAQLAVVDNLVAQSGKPCVIKDRSFVGATDSGKMYYEVACQNGKGYMLEQASSGAFAHAMDCTEADSIGGGCKLTDSRQAKTEQDALYTALSNKAGFPCQVSGYAPLPLTPAYKGSEVVELSCANRPDGGIAVFAPAGGKSMVFDCAHSELVGYRCSLTKAAAAYPRLTADLKSLGKGSCATSNSRMVGITPDKRGFLEVACSDGLQGYMIEYTLSPIEPKIAIVCGEAKGIAGGCTLPGNVNPKKS